MLSHDVYFTLKDPSPENIQTLVDDCHTYLDKHPGLVFFGAGPLEPELARPVNDRAFHVALHVVFTDRAAHDAYQVEERHLTFIARNKETWAQVRVFDSLC
ncbi:MAG: Dabb family protein [Pirellulaceae bacterium]